MMQQVNLDDHAGSFQPWDLWTTIGTLAMAG